MVSVIPMNISLINNPAARFGGDVRTFRKNAVADHEFCLSDVHTSPGSLPQTPESFVVTPEGQTLPGIRELHVDADGSLRIVDRVPRDLQFDFTARSPPHPHTLPQVPNSRFLHLTPPPAGSPLIKWNARPGITWNRPFDSEPLQKQRDTVQVFMVAEDGTTEVKSIALREFRKRYNEKEMDFKYVVEEGGAVHRAHCVFIGGPEAEVVLRGDDDDGAVYDHIRTPAPTLTPFSDIVYIAEDSGRTHCGTNVMIADAEGNTTVLSRIAAWPALFVTNTTDQPIYLAYTAPPQLGWKQTEQPDKTTNECFVIERPGGVYETYNRILLASNESVFLAYRSASDVDALIISDGSTLRTASLIKKPSLEAGMTPVIIAGPNGVSHFGVNVLLSSPGGFVPVGRVASVSKAVQKQLQDGLIDDDVPMLVGWPQRLYILNEPHKTAASATKSLEDKIATKLSGKVPRLDEPLSPSTKRSPTQIIIGTPDKPGVRSFLPPVDSWAGVLLAGDGPLKLGHSVISMGSSSNESNISFAVDGDQ